MSIAVGSRIPAGELGIMGADGPGSISTEQLFAGKTVVLFAVPGAFTPTCSNAHLPGFLRHADALRAKGVDTIACLSVNDSFVMYAWGRDQRAGDKVLMLADGNGAFTRALGLEMDASQWGMGQRSRRYSMLVEDGVVKLLNVEPGGGLGVSSAEHLLEQI